MDLLFFLFFLSLLTVLGIIFSTNPIHSVLFFILTILCLSFCLISVGLDFLGLVLIVVYIGAIAVLFLFIVMMLNIKILELKMTYWYVLPVSFFFLIFFSFQLLFLLSEFSVISNSLPHLSTNWLYSLTSMSTLLSLGSVLYTYYLMFFFLISLILFLAMISSMVLTLNQNLYVKRQDIFEQREKLLTNSIQFF